MGAGSWSLAGFDRGVAVIGDGGQMGEQELWSRMYLKEVPPVRPAFEHAGRHLDVTPGFASSCDHVVVDGRWYAT